MTKNDRLATIGKLTQFKPGQSGNPNGRPKGRKSLATIIREMENEEFNWDILPTKNNEKLREFVEQVAPMGSPFRAIVMKMALEALQGNVKAAEWIRKAGYGDKLDLTSKGERIRQEPIVVSTITPRYANTQTETEESPGSGQ